MLKRWLLIYLLSSIITSEVSAQDTLPLSPKIPNWHHLAIDRSDTTLVVKIFANGSMSPQHTKIFNLIKQADRTIKFKTDRDDSAFTSFVGTLGADIEKRGFVTNIEKQPDGRYLIALINSPQNNINIDSAKIAEIINARSSIPERNTLILAVITGVLITGIGWLIYNVSKNTSVLKSLQSNRTTYTISDDLIIPLLNNENKDPKNGGEIINYVLQQYKDNHAKQIQGVQALEEKLNEALEQKKQKEEELKNTKESLDAKVLLCQQLESDKERLEADDSKSAESITLYKNIASRIYEDFYRPMMNTLEAPVDQNETKKTILIGLTKIALASMSMNRLLANKKLNSDPMDIDYLLKKQTTTIGSINSQSQFKQTNPLPYYVMKLLHENDIKSLDDVLIDGYKIAN